MSDKKPTPQSTDFWNSYEREVRPSHFAKLKSIASGHPETFPGYRDDKPGHSDEFAHIPDQHLHDHAKAAQAAVHAYLKKERPDALSYKRVKNPDGTITKEPHVTVYRGVSGDYAKKLLDAFAYDHSQQEVDNHRISTDTLPFHSWSLSPHIAASFGNRKIKDQSNAGMVIQKQLPLKDLLHEGFIGGHDHVHPEEEELVFAHPTNKIQISVKNLHGAKGENQMGFPAAVQPRSQKLAPVLKAAASGKKLSEEQLGSLLMSGNRDHQVLAMNHPGLTPALMAKAKHELTNLAIDFSAKRGLGHREERRFHNLLSHPLTSPEEVEQVVPNLNGAALTVLHKHHPEKLTSKAIDQIIASKADSTTYSKLAKFPAFNEAHEKAILKQNPGNARVLIHGPHSSEDVLTRALDQAPKIDSMLAHPKLTAEHLHKLIQLGAANTHPELWSHPKIDESHVLSALNIPADADGNAIANAKDALFVAHERGFDHAIKAGERHKHPKIKEKAMELAQKFKKSEDAVDLRLKLKSKHTSPEDLRAALQDEDPKIRLIAAKHPNITEELLKEIGASDDEWLKAQVADNPVNKSVSDDPKVWGETLLKTQEEEELEHIAVQLGIDPRVSDYISAVHLLSGKNLSIEDINKFVASSGGDMLLATLKAAGMDTATDKANVERAIGFVQLYKSEEEKPKIKVITPLTASAKPVADLLTKANEADKIEYVKLNGRNSNGSMLATDPETDKVVLLKPKTPKMSPAQGVNETAISAPARECAFYSGAQALGLASDVPYSYWVSIDGQEYAAIEFFGEGFESLEKMRMKDPAQVGVALTPYMKTGRIFKWAAMDYLLGNVDRHGNNMMVSKQDGRTKLIDHGSAFAGGAFNPGGDKDSFIPYYLRIWNSNKEFAKLAPDERMKLMPEADYLTDFNIKDWVANLDENELIKALAPYKLDMNPIIKRLHTLKKGVSQGSISKYINFLWAYPAS